MTILMPDGRLVPLHPQLTVVTGPNGCGKSAFIEAAILTLRKGRTNDVVLRTLGSCRGPVAVPTLRDLLGGLDVPRGGAGLRKLHDLFVGTWDAARHTLPPTAASEARGTLLVDDLDQDLDPTWQQHVVPALRAAFPALRLVLTTRSAIVLSTVRAEHVRVLSPGHPDVVTPTRQTIAVEPDDILASVFHLDPRPNLPEAHAVSRLYHLIQEGLLESAEATALRRDVVTTYGDRHPVVLNLERSIRLQAFKLRRT